MSMAHHISPLQQYRWEYIAQVFLYQNFVEFLLSPSAVQAFQKSVMFVVLSTQKKARTYTVIAMGTNNAIIPIFTAGDSNGFFLFFFSPYVTPNHSLSSSILPNLPFICRHFFSHFVFPMNIVEFIVQNIVKYNLIVVNWINIGGNILCGKTLRNLL